jgi:single-strand DNA-binding protein
MASVNKVILVGNLGKDPDVRFTGTGKAVANFPLATTDTWNDTSGVKQEKTEWHNVVVWGKQAENCGQYLAKGRQVYVEGAIRSRSYDDKEGNKRYITEVVADRVQFLGTGRGQTGVGVSSGADAGPDPFGGVPDDDVPF